jgi:hypothetical protein
MGEGRVQIGSAGFQEGFGGGGGGWGRFPLKPRNRHAPTACHHCSVGCRPTTVTPGVSVACRCASLEEGVVAGFISPRFRRNSPCGRPDGSHPTGETEHQHVPERHAQARRCAHRLLDTF